MTPEIDIIAFHVQCPDGFAAAYVGHLKYPDAELLPLDHGAALDMEQFRDRNVLMLDFSLRTREQNDELARITKYFHIYDHHKTAEAVLAGAEYATFDMDRSGAGLAWDFLFGRDQLTIRSDVYWKDRPWWVSYVEDRDLWRFKLPNSVEVNDYIMTFEYTVESWAKMTQSNPHNAATAGENIRLQVEKYVREASKQAQRGSLSLNGKTYSVLIVNVPYLNTSEVGNELSKTADIGVGWFERGDGMLQFSLRSRGDIDVSEVAKAFNGGGHQHAAGFQVSLDKGRRVVDTILGRDTEKPENSFGGY